MKKTKKAASLSATQGNGTETQAEKTFVPKREYIPDRAATQGIVEFFLMQGKENSISSNNLVKLTQCSSDRQLRRMITKERERGTLILFSHSGGYFLPDDGEKGDLEIKDFIRTLQASVDSTNNILRMARKAFRQREKGNGKKNTGIYDL